MENLDLKQMSAMVDIIAEEKGLPRETVLSVIEQAIAAAWRKDHGDRDMNVRAVLSTETGEATVFVAREVIEDGVAYNPSTEVPLAAAGEDAELGGIVEESLPVTDFGRVAAMTAKQVVIQRLREAENNAVLAEYEDKIGTVVTGTVSRVEPKLVRIDMGRGTGIMPRSEQIDGEYYTVGSRIKVYIKKVERGDRGAQLVLSRGCPEFVEYLFRQEVPELVSGTVEIRGIAREAGRRTKIAVAPTVSGIDPVGTFVGGRGIRVQAVMEEIGNREKIDIVTWSENPSEYIREALSPAEINRVEIIEGGEPENATAEVTTADATTEVVSEEATEGATEEAAEATEAAVGETTEGAESGVETAEGTTTTENTEVAEDAVAATESVESIASAAPAAEPAKPAKSKRVRRKAKVYVTEDQQSIAIGKQGQNVRLASKLTGYDLDIELIKSVKKKKSKNAEDTLMSALEDSTEEPAEEAADGPAAETAE